MLWLRLLVFAGCVASISYAVSHVPWQSHLVSRDTTYIINLKPHPIWNFPDAPDFPAFQHHFRESKNFPRPNDHWAIHVQYDPVEVAILATAYCWPVLMMCGLLYLAVRRGRHDLVLHIVLSLAVGLAGAVLACIAMWCVIGGWGPPFVSFFVLLGGIAGWRHGFGTRHQPTH